MKPTNKLLVLALLAGAFAPRGTLAQTAQAESARAVQASNPLKEFGDLVAGRWMSEIVFAVDLPGLGKKGDKVTGFDTWRWAVDGALLENNWLLGATSGRVTAWWDASAGQIMALEVDSGGGWAQGPIVKQRAKWVWSRAGAFTDGRRVEFLGSYSVEDNGQTLIHAGTAILEGARNEYRDVYRRVGK